MLKDTIPLVLIPLDERVDLSDLSLKIQKTLKKNSIDALIFPLSKSSPLSDRHIWQLIADGKKNTILEEIAAQYETLKVQKKEAIIVEGIALNITRPFSTELNLSISQALNARVILVASETTDNLNELFRIFKFYYQNEFMGKVIGGIIDNSEAKIASIKDRVPIFQKELPLLGTKNIDGELFKKLLANTYEQKITPPFFRNKLLQLARKANKTIVLPEGDEPRTLKAAAICAEKNIAKCILLGDFANIHKVAEENSIAIDLEGISIINPKKISARFIEPLLKLRRHKNLTLDEAKKELEDNVVLGTMMLKTEEADGLVSGAIHTTANTVRPALQLIKTRPNVSLASSIFFMCLPTQVLIFGDCGLNTNPSDLDLADIAIQSADTALNFGLPARVAFLSYSTGRSGFGKDVEKVNNAVKIAREKRPDLNFDGPLQYDAAFSEEVAMLKMPDSKVAGKATIYIFPDLDAGNIAYKAVQRSTNIICMGPLLQGLKKSINDLSRGCSVEDIIFTIAFTAIQANFNQ